MKTYVQVSARLDVDTARLLEELKETYGTTVGTLEAAIRHLHATHDTDAVSTPTAPRQAKPASNRAYGQTEEERETLARILELDNAGKRKGEIVKTLNAEQRKTRTGTAWTIQRLSTILKTAKGGNE